MENVIDGGIIINGQKYPFGSASLLVMERFDCEVLDGGLSNLGAIFSNENWHHAIINVKEGEVYKVNCAGVNAQYPSAYYRKNNSFISNAFDDITIAHEDEIITIPSGVDALVLNCYGGKLSVEKFVQYKQRQITMSNVYKNEADILQINNELLRKDFEIDMLSKRCESLESIDEFIWNDFDKPYFVFIHDDATWLLDFADTFISNNVPLTSAAIPEYINPEIKVAMDNIVANGGEILAHYNTSPQQSDDDSVWMSATGDVKFALENLGFEVNGIIRANNTQANCEKGERFCRRYFKFANSGMGQSTQYNIPRTLMLSFANFEAFMEQIAQDATVNGIHAYGFHGHRSDEAWITTENLITLFNTIKGYDNCEFSTFGDLYNRFGTTKLRKLLK